MPIIIVFIFFLLILKEIKIKPFSCTPESMVAPEPWVSCA